MFGVIINNQIGKQIKTVALENQFGKQVKRVVVNKQTRKEEKKGWLLKTNLGKR